MNSIILTVIGVSLAAAAAVLVVTHAPSVDASRVASVANVHASDANIEQINRLLQRP